MIMFAGARVHAVVRPASFASKRRLCMALKNLSSEAMVTITGRLLDPERDRPVVEPLPVLSTMIPAIEMVHTRMLARQHLVAAILRELAKVVDGMSAVDKLHDRKKRGAYGYLTALAELTDNTVTAAAYLDLRDRLMPLGLMEIRRSYVDQVGDAQLLPGRLDDASRALLASIITPEGPLQSQVDQWVAAAAELGRLEERRAQLESQRSTGPEASPGEVYAARLAWMRVMRSMIELLEVDPQATPEIKARLLAPLRRAEAQAGRRRGGDVEDGDGGDLEDPDDVAPNPELPVPDDGLVTAPAPADRAD
jgi:hypothetical protein